MDHQKKQNIPLGTFLAPSAQIENSSSVFFRNLKKKLENYRIFNESIEFVIEKWMSKGSRDV